MCKFSLFPYSFLVQSPLFEFRTFFEALLICVASGIREMALPTFSRTSKKSWKRSLRAGLQDWEKRCPATSWASRTSRAGPGSSGWSFRREMSNVPGRSGKSLVAELRWHDRRVTTGPPCCLKRRRRIRKRLKKTRLDICLPHCHGSSHRCLLS